MALPLLGYIRLKLIAVLIRCIVRIAHIIRVFHPEPKCKNKQRLRIASRDAGRFILADLYTPEQTSTSTSTKNEDDDTKPTPIIINFHGSGFVIPSLGSDSGYCSFIANETGIPVLDADYRKGPEHPFPAALEDVFDVLCWTITAQSARFDAKNIVLSGFSAGANLALVASSSSSSSSSLLLQKKQQNLLPSEEENGFKIKAVVAFYHITNMTIPPETKTAPKPHYPIHPALARIFNACYVTDSMRDRSIMRNPLISPSFIPEEEFPDTVVIITCEGDTLAGEGNELAERLKEKGTGGDGSEEGKGRRRKVVNVQLEGVGHAFDKFPGDVERKRRDEAYGLAVDVLRGVFGK
ncbi:hypothetical protein DTO271G3_3315 [Paecilomyces variotii]|nr:hypothetical protein DTO271G3_3315 [Paecilomyces variotii]